MGKRKYIEINQDYTSQSKKKDIINPKLVTSAKDSPHNLKEMVKDKCRYISKYSTFLIWRNKIEVSRFDTCLVRIGFRFDHENL